MNIHHTDHHTQQHKDQDHGHTDANLNVGHTVKTPAQAADQVDHRVEQGDLLPERRQHVDRVKGTAEEGQRGDDHHRDDLQLLEIVSPQADDETEQAEADGGQQQKAEHPERMQDFVINKQTRCQQE